MLTDLLRHGFLFQDLDDELARKLLDACELVRLPRGATLMKQGDTGDSLYFLVAGRLRFYIDGDDPRDALVGEVSAGETVGEMALLTDEPRTATVRTIRDSILLRLDRDAFDRLVASSSVLMRRMAKMIVLRQSRIRSAAARRAPAVFALLPVDASVPIAWFREQFSDQLAQIGTVRAFDATEFQQDLSRHRNLPAGERAFLLGAADQSETDQWFTYHEAKHDRLLLVGDPNATAWNEHCMRSADVILLLGRFASDAGLTEVDLQIKALQDGPECPAVDLLLLHEPTVERIEGTSTWLDPRKVRHHFHVRKSLGDIARLGRILTDRAVGVVLSGGGARGFAHIGVLKALSESKFAIDFIGGCSMGSLISAQHALGWDWQQLLAVNKEFWTATKIWDYTVPFISLIAGRFGCKSLSKMFGNLRIEDLMTSYYCVTSDLTNAALSVHDRGLLWKAVSASASIPGVVPPQVFDGRLHVDGGILNNLPVGVMRDLTRGPILAVDVAAVTDLAVDPRLQQLPTGGALLRSRLNPLAAKIDAPNIFGILRRSAVLASIMRTSEVRSLADVYVRPEVARFSMFDFRQIHALVDSGYAAMQAQMSQWENAISQAASGSLRTDT